MHFFRLFLDFFFPPDCVVCGEEGNILCASCVQKIDGQHFYAFSSESLENIFVLGEYEDPVLEKAIHALKYHFSEDMGIHLLPFLRAQLSRVSLPSSAILVPIPLHFFVFFCLFWGKVPHGIRGEVYLFVPFFKLL